VTLKSDGPLVGTKTKLEAALHARSKCRASPEVVDASNEDGDRGPEARG
jgi:hypothetical protein